MCAVFIFGSIGRVILIGAALVLLPSILLAKEKVLTIAADESCPINCKVDDVMPGIGIELAQKIFEPEGYRVRYIVMPWARALADVRRGKVDAVVGANKEDGPNLVFPKTPIYDMTDDFYARRQQAPKDISLAELENKRIGTIKDYGYGRATQALLARLQPGTTEQVYGRDAVEQNLRKLVTGRIDVMIESAPVMRAAIARLKLQDKVVHVGSLLQGPVYLAFSPTSPQSTEYAKAYDTGMARLKREGVARMLYEKYGLGDGAP